MSCAPKTVTLHRAMSYVTPHLMTPSTGTPSSHVLHPPFSEHKPCGDLQPHLSGALWLSSDPSQVMSPSSLLNTRITGISPKTSSSLNTRMYVSNLCPSTNQSQRRRGFGRHSTHLAKSARHNSQNRFFFRGFMIPSLKSVGPGL